MTLKEIINFLESQDQERVVPKGWGKGSAHSYRGCYCDLAFEPKDNASISEMLAEAKSAVGKEFTGYKGGEYCMGASTDCYLAEYGFCGDELSLPLLQVMCGEIPGLGRAVAEAVSTEQERTAEYLSSLWASSTLEGDEISITVKIKVPFLMNEKTNSTILRAIRSAAK